MHNQFKSEQGFTLIELVMVIAILGILAVAALPIFRDLADDAQEAARQGVVGAVRGGINTSYAYAIADPTRLDQFVGRLDSPGAHPCNTFTPCFDIVLAYPVTDGTWGKINATQYRHNGTGIIMTYNSVSGTFL